MTITLADVVSSYGDDDPARFIAIADHFLRLEDVAAAAAALDRAYGLASDDAGLASHRAAILDQLAIHEHGMTWRYVPAGTFIMGSSSGDPDERPVHPRRVDAFWIADAPLSWSELTSAIGDLPIKEDGWDRTQRRKVRSYYSSDRERHPAVAVTIEEANAAAAGLTRRGAARFALPSEAQWEKAARGGLVGRRYSWGDEPPSTERCDFDRMGDFQLADRRSRPPNGYGLYGVCGCVSELTADDYDALAYAARGERAPTDVDLPLTTVIRGGSWIDCAAAVTVSFRATVANQSPTPTIGVRLVRVD